MNNNSVTVQCNPSGRSGVATLTARLGGEVLAVESVNLTKPTARDRFANAVCEGRPGIDREKLDAELLRLAAGVANKPKPAPADLDILPELDISSIVRPERLIVPEVSGLAVPSMTTMGDSVQGRWHLYLRWADGKRERRPMAKVLELPGGRRLWIHPEPGEPMPTMKPGWSIAARKGWLKGEPAADPAELFTAMLTTFARFIDLPAVHAPGVTATAVCWAILSYVYQAWDAVPYLYIGGPLGSGKSRLFEVLARLVFRPLSSSNMTGPALFRTLHSQGGVLLLDEAERLRNTQDPGTSEILSMLLAGYKRGGTATRLEKVGDGVFKPEFYDVFGPKALACIAGLPPPLRSRAIPVTMFRSPPGSEKPRRRIDADPSGWQRLRDNLHALAMEHGPTWLELPSRTDVCPTMSGRDYELWQPLLALAWWIESHGARGLLSLLQEHAMATIESGRDDATPDHDETLLRILAERRSNGDAPQPKEILEAARELDPVSYRQWSPKGVGNVFRRYGLETKEIHGRKVYRADLSELVRIQEVYGLSLGLNQTEAPEG